MKIAIQIRSVYGNTTAYPMCDKAKAFARIAGTKTLTREALRQIDALGYEFENQAVTITEPVTIAQLTSVLTQ